ncbi:MAG: 2-hydroxyacid dehydrogenase [bacterium]
MKEKPLVVYPDADGNEEELYPEQFARIREVANLKIYRGQPDSHEEYIQRIGDAQGVFLGWDLPGEVMRQAGKLEVISFTGIGVNKFVDMEQARERNISVCNCPGYSDITVAEHTMALLLSLSRGVPGLDHDIRNGIWKSQSTAMELHGKQIGLVGFGGIGQWFSGLCMAFGMNVLVWTRSMNSEYESRFGVQLCSLNEIYENCPIISLHLSSNPQTEGIIDHEAFNAMQPGTMLINTARAELIVEDALIRALQSGRLSAAALDVFHQEPLPAGHPLTEMQNVVLTPHIGYNTPEAVSRLYEIAAENIVSYFQGKPANTVS